MEIRNLFGEMKQKIVGKRLRIVFPEGTDERVVRAAARLKFEGLVEPIILGVPEDVHTLLTDFGFSNPGITVINPNNYANFDTMRQEFITLRKGKVDEMIEKAVKAGGTDYIPAKDYGWMYQRTFLDPDGHHWEVFYMDESQIPSEM